MNNYNLKGEVAFIDKPIKGARATGNTNSVLMLIKQVQASASKRRKVKAVQKD